MKLQGQVSGTIAARVVLRSEWGYIRREIKTTFLGRRAGMQLSIVVPVYRSAECLPELVRCIEKGVADYFQIYELILVNDDSPDTSWEVIQRLAFEHNFITGVNLQQCHHGRIKCRDRRGRRNHG
jgi:glycosyltransferase involved in cell wall biosynthesis